jgi:hypothetical protein
MEDNQIQTLPYPTQVKIQKEKDETQRQIPKTDKQDISTKEEMEQNKKPPDLTNEIADV